MNSERIKVINEIHAPARRNFRRRHVIMRGLNECWQADLIDLQKYSKANNGYKYVLTIIDILSKFAWAIPLKTKSGLEITKAFSKLFERGTKPEKIHTDQGKEFYNVHFKALLNKYNVKLYSTYSVLKASIVERFNRTLKEKIFKLFSLNGNYKWTNLLTKTINEYNSTKHSTIGMRPKDVTNKEAKLLLSTVYKYNDYNSIKNKFNINDFVRISKYKHLFSKSYTPNWTTEIFQIKKIQNTDPVTYLIVDQKNTPIQGGFYEYELQKVANPNVYLIEKILKKNKNKIFVKWLGLDSKQNSWIKANDVLK